MYTCHNKHRITPDFNVVLLNALELDYTLKLYYILNGITFKYPQVSTS